jgi:hypothetical protein
MGACGLQPLGFVHGTGYEGKKAHNRKKGFRSVRRKKATYILYCTDLISLTGGHIAFQGGPERLNAFMQL